MVQNNKHLLSHNFCRSRVQEWISYVVLAQHLSWETRCQPELQSSKVFGTEGSTSKIAYTHPWQISASCWQESFSFSLCRSLHGAEYHHNMEAGSLQRKWSKRAHAEAVSLLWPSLRRPYSLFIWIVLVTQTDPATEWEGTTQDMNTRRQRSLGILLESGLQWRKAFSTPSSF